MTYLCIDVGATKVYLGILEEEFKNIIKIDTKEFLDGSNEILNDISKDYQIEKTCTALPGPLNLEDGEIYPPNIPKKSIKIDPVFKTIQSDITFINDCHAGVIGEHIYGEKRSDDMIYLTISTGIGAGVITNGRLIKGWDGNFAEVGHMFVGGDRTCGCGGEGHWEAYCSGNNIIDFAEELTKRSYENPKHLFKSYHNGEPEANKVINKFQEINVRAFTNIINMYNPEVIMIGGSLAINNPDVILGDKKDNLSSSIVNPMPNIQITGLKNYSVLYGLKGICLDEFEY